MCHFLFTCNSRFTYAKVHKFQNGTNCITKYFISQRTYETFYPVRLKINRFAFARSAFKSLCTLFDRLRGVTTVSVSLSRDMVDHA